MKNILLAAGFLFPALALACLHYPIDYPGTVTEHKQEFFVFSTSENFHLVAKTNLSSVDALPARLAWIFPLPSVPLKYEEVSPHVFNELYDLTLPQTNLLKGVFQNDSISQSRGVTQGLVVHDAVTVGRYKVRPLEILNTDPKTASALDTWLKENGLKKMPKEKQTQYLKKGAVFLVIDADLKGLKAADFKPLHIVLKPLKEYALPLNFTHDGRSFDVDAYSLGMKLSSPTGGLRLSSSYKLTGTERTVAELRKIIGKSTGELSKYSGTYDGKGVTAQDPVFSDSNVSAVETLKNPLRR